MCRRDSYTYLQPKNFHTNHRGFLKDPLLKMFILGLSCNGYLGRKIRGRWKGAISYVVEFELKFFIALLGIVFHLLSALPDTDGQKVDIFSLAKPVYQQEFIQSLICTLIHTTTGYFYFHNYAVISLFHFLFFFA